MINDVMTGKRIVVKLTLTDFFFEKTLNIVWLFQKFIVSLCYEKIINNNINLKYQ